MVAQLPQRRWSGIANGGGMTAPTYPVQPNRVQSFPLQAGSMGGGTAMSRLQEMMQAGQAPTPQMAPQQAAGGQQMAPGGGGVGGGDIIGALGYGLASGDMGAASRLLLTQRAAAREQAMQQQQLGQAIAWLDSRDPRLGEAARANPAMIDDLMKQAMEPPPEYKAPQVFDYFDEQTGRQRKGYMTPQGVVPVGGAEAPEPVEPEEPDVIEVFDEKTGQPRKMLFYPKSKRMEPLGGVKAPSDSIEMVINPDGSSSFRIGGSQKEMKDGERTVAEHAAVAGQAHAALTPEAENVLTNGWQKAGGLLLSGMGMEGYAQTPEYQMAAQHAKLFINAVARRQSGATVRPDEWTDYGQMFIPQPGNDTKVIQAKREAREWALNAMQAGLTTDTIKRYGMAHVGGGQPLPDPAAIAAREGGDGLGQALQGTVTVPGTGAKVPWRIVK
jgi:hypothetical protein